MHSMTQAVSITPTMTVKIAAAQLIGIKMSHLLTASRPTARAAMFTPILMDERFLSAVRASAVAFTVLLSWSITVHFCAELLTSESESVDRLSSHEIPPSRNLLTVLV